tara:strand:+ start:140 stop:832 length:693 start_codon:yes stop_codon:yes gene_type:complete
MKKITLALVMLLTSFSMAYAELGVKVGISGQIGAFEATGREHEGSTTAASREVSGKDDVLTAFGYTSVFVEKSLGFLPGPLGRLSIGFDHVPAALESETSSTTRPDLLAKASGAAASVVNSVKVDFEDLNTVYASLNITDNLYINYGLVSVDVKTKESLGTGSSYGDTDLSGTSMGMGYHKSFDSGFFFRASAHVLEFDGVNMTSANNMNLIKVDQINGVSGKLSLGKSF